MATITGLTAERMLVIEGASVVDGEIIGPNLVLTKHDGTQITAGPVVGPPGPTGPQGPPAISSIPGEIKMWPDDILPELATYGKWVWADGAAYPVATYPISAAHISVAWRTAHGAADPGGTNFRVPDLRGLVPAGLDAMPGGARANRMTRAVAITLAGKTGEETHIITVPELAAHTHTGVITQQKAKGDWVNDQGLMGNGDPTQVLGPSSSITINSTGGSVAHENVQPTVFVPYIVYLGG